MQVSALPRIVTINSARIVLKFGRQRRDNWARIDLNKCRVVLTVLTMIYKLFIASREKLWSQCTYKGIKIQSLADPRYSSDHYISSLTSHIRSSSCHNKVRLVSSYTSFEHDDSLVWTKYFPWSLLSNGFVIKWYSSSAFLTSIPHLPQPAD